MRSVSPGRAKAMLLVAWLLPAQVRAEQAAEVQAAEVLESARRYFVRMACETALVSRTEMEYRKLEADIAAGRVPPDRLKTAKEAFGHQLKMIWQSEALPSKDYLKVK